MITEPLRVINFVTFDEGAASIWIALLVKEPQTRQSPPSAGFRYQQPIFCTLLSTKFIYQVERTISFFLEKVFVFDLT